MFPSYRTSVVLTDPLSPPWTHWEEDASGLDELFDGGLLIERKPSPNTSKCKFLIVH